MLRTLWLAIPLALVFMPCHAAEEYKYRAIMAKYFISQHSAIPLFSNSNAKSGSVLSLLGEATVSSREQCYSLDKPAYRRLGNEAVANSGGAGLELSGQGTAYRVVDIIGKAGAASASSDQISLELSEEEPQKGAAKGLSLLTTPKATCSEITALLSGGRSKNILVTRVFWGTAQAMTSFKMAGSLSAEAQARLGKDLARVLGTSPKIGADAKGSSVVIQINSIVQPRSLAVQSAVVNPQTLARVYAAATGKNATLAQLEKQVADYLDADRSTAQKLATAIRSFLIDLKIIQRDPQEFYDDLFSGIKPGASAPANGEKRDAKVWNAIGTVASAVEIAKSANGQELVRP